MSILLSTVAFVLDPSHGHLIILRVKSLFWLILSVNETVPNNSNLHT